MTAMTKMKGLATAAGFASLLMTGGRYPPSPKT